ncbi:hypothetical protein LEP1GSC021_0299 [Leptospira noguchii str. 1993005606]|uniref:Uncharacterized protein n=1 Tax=Leptospira noguchii str. 2007001578 TaxID=1049974 RepID=A0ABP2TE21_9LEPT|nr:hypothetical protein LEP1GSC035_2558 [Leptospira noguchii str. 2007001578]EPE84965.1 hypothetical protein LEP1GSC021_0299 [Leptospira noguchii str. 1993005606]
MGSYELPYPNASQSELGIPLNLFLFALIKTASQILLGRIFSNS